MRKEGWRQGLRAAICIGIVCGALLCAPAARADNARDSVVNPGNARYLGPSERANDKAPEEIAEAEEGDTVDAPPADELEAGDDEDEPQLSATELPAGMADDLPPLPEVVADAEDMLTDADLEEADSVEPTPEMLAEAEERLGRRELRSPGCGCDKDCGGCPDCAEAAKKAHGIYEFHGPMAVIGQHPPSILFYQPVPDAATVLPKGAGTLNVNLDWTNLIIRELDSGVVVDYDFEVLRTTFDYRQRLGAGELQARLPVDYRSHGILDRTIEGWHRIFGMNNGLRDTYPEGQYRYTIIGRNGLVHNDVGDVFGIGDLSLAYKQPLWGDAHSREAAAWRVGLKAPTGDSADALGSGNWDYSAGVLYQRSFGGRLRLYANVDYVFTGEPDWQNVETKDALHTLWAAEYAWSPRFSLVAQYNTADNPLRIGSFEADKNPRELTIGFNHRLSDRLIWSGGFREDISPETAPDLAFLSHMKWEF